MFEQFHKLYTFSCIGCTSVQSGAFWIICQLYPPARVAWNHGISHPSDWQVSINPISIFEEYFIGYVWRWHLGYCHEDYLPTSRGFHTFNGFLNGFTDHYLYTSQGQKTARYIYIQIYQFSHNDVRKLQREDSQWAMIFGMAKKLISKLKANIQQ